MMDSRDVIMGFLDLVPVLLFFGAGVILQTCYFNKMSKGTFAFFAVGTISVSISGLFKAVHKILLTLRICDFVVLKDSLMPFLAFGFLLSGFAVMTVLFKNQSKAVKTYGFAPLAVAMSFFGNYDDVPVFSGTMIFVGVMIVGLIMLEAGLIFAAVKMKKYGIVCILIISFIGSLGMGYLSSQEAINDLIKEGVNTVAQGSFLVASILLKKHGFAKADAIVTINQNKRLQA